MPASELRRASLPSLRIMTEAEETVEESEMLSVDAFRRELNRDAARDFFLVGTAVEDASSGLSGVRGLELPLGKLIVAPGLT